MSNKMYDILKKIAQYWVPALAIFYYSIARIWGLPYSEEIVATLSAFDLFLGTVLGISTAMYNQQKDILSSIHVVKEEEHDETV